MAEEEKVNEVRQTTAFPPKVEEKPAPQVRDTGNKNETLPQRIELQAEAVAKDIMANRVKGEAELQKMLSASITRLVQRAQADAKNLSIESTDMKATLSSFVQRFQSLGVDPGDVKKALQEAADGIVHET